MYSKNIRNLNSWKVISERSDEEADGNSTATLKLLLECLSQPRKVAHILQIFRLRFPPMTESRAHREREGSPGPWEMTTHDTKQGTPGTEKAVPLRPANSPPGIYTPQRAIGFGQNLEATKETPFRGWMNEHAVEHPRNRMSVIG